MSIFLSGSEDAATDDDDELRAASWRDNLIQRDPALLTGQSKIILTTRITPHAHALHYICILKMFMKLSGTDGLK